MVSDGTSSLQLMADTREQEEQMTTVVAEAARISYPEAQRYSGLGRTKLWELISNGEVEAAKVGKAVRISRTSLDGYMRRHSYVGAKG
jgi:excisionase family DNA binding protein